MGEGLIEVLLISAKCLLGIFIVIGIVFLMVLILNKVGKGRTKKEDQDPK